jgi:hypothetical protein
MSSITQGAPLPDITKTTTTTQTAPDYYTNYLTDLGKVGQDALKTTAAQGIAAYDPLQTQGYGALPAAADAYKTGLSAAGLTAADAAKGITPERIKALMNPYTTDVVKEMERLSQQNVQRNLLPSLRAGFVGSGGLGSQRYAGALGQSLADIQSNLTGQQYGALSKGYEGALKAAIDEMQGQTAASRAQAEIAGKEQELGLTGAQALTKAGAERQKYEQSILDYPLSQAANVAGLMRGYQVPISNVQKFVGPEAGAYRTSPLALATGLLGVVGSGAAGTAADRISGIWKNIMKSYNAANQDASAGSQGAADDVYQGADGFSTDPNRLMNIFDTDPPPDD